MVAVFDVKKRVCHYYASKEPGLHRIEVSSKDYVYMGNAKWPDDPVAFSAAHKAKMKALAEARDKKGGK